MKRLIVTAFIIVLALNTRAQSHKFFLRKKITIDSICILAPISNIYTLAKEDSLQIDVSLSQLAETGISKTLQQFFPESVNHVYKDLAIDEKDKIKNSITEHMNSNVTLASIKKMTLDDSLFNYINKANLHYSLIILNSGFIRTQTNVINEIIKTKLLNAFFIGLAGSVNSPITVKIRLNEKASVITAILIDNRNHTIAFLKSVSNENDDPYNEYVLKGMVREIITDCFP